VIAKAVIFTFEMPFCCPTNYIKTLKKVDQYLSMYKFDFSYLCAFWFHCSVEISYRPCVVLHIATSHKHHHPLATTIVTESLFFLWTLVLTDGQRSWSLILGLESESVLLGPESIGV